MTSIPRSRQATPNRLPQSLPSLCHLFKFPNELLAEAISWLPHPVNILWLSFTCRRFHNLLTDPASSYIWKRARERFITIKTCSLTQTATNPGPSEMTGIIEIPGQEVLLYFEFIATPIPPPFEGQSEYTFARMLFGWKRCQRCEKGYIGKPYSVLMRMALCPDCVEKHEKEFRRTHLIARSQAHAEWQALALDKTEGNMEYFNKILNASLQEEPPRSIYEQHIGRPTASRSEWDRLLTEFLTIKETKQSSKLRHFLDVTLKVHTERVVSRQKHASLVVQWYQRYNDHLEVITNGILKSSQLFATMHGLIIEDLQKAPAYRHAVTIAGRHRTMDIFPFLVPETHKITSQTLKIQANRIRSSTTLAHKTRRKEVEAFYKAYKFPNDIKPTLHTFRGFPILQALQRGISTAGMKSQDSLPMPYYHSRPISALSERPSIQADLRENMAHELVDVNVMQWREGAILGARKLLGFGEDKRKGNKRGNKRKDKSKQGEATMQIDGVESSNEPIHPQVEVDASRLMDVNGAGENSSDQSPPKWHSVPGKLDPEMRVTSWFVCTSCTNMDPGYKRMRVLDFRGICAHECWQKDWSKAQRKNWNIDRFALAPRAIETAKRMLEILGLDAEDPKTTTRSLKGWWSCNNCPSWISGMVWEDLLRHCQRHETQDIAQLADEDAEKRRNNLGYERKRLTFADLLSGKYETEARTKQLACVHCRPTQGSDNTRSHNLAFSAASSKAEKVMDIHGIRQHMKSKHDVSDCRNEDYYYVADDRVIPPTAPREAPPTTGKEKRNNVLIIY